MSGELNVISRTQTIFVDPVSGSVSIINAGPIGPVGLTGPTGPTGADGGLTTVLLNITTPITLFTLLAPIPDYTWTEVDIGCYAALFVRFTILSSASSNFSYKLTSQPSGAGDEMLTAAGFPTAESILSWPWWYNNNKSPRETKMYIGIRNTGAIPSTFTITDLRGYSLEV